MLKDILHLPAIAKNLLSVSKFTHDNDVYFEFHQDKTINATLLEGTLMKGLYAFDFEPKHMKNVKMLTVASLTTSIITLDINKVSKTDVINEIKIVKQHAFLCTGSESFLLWHKRLVHSSSKIYKQFLKQRALNFL